ncbi:death on curing protein, Doc toxin [Vibrio cholerae]|nr:death on curing protein, Doc toxin [Vibrio cholerae]
MMHHLKIKSMTAQNKHNKRLKRDCQRVAFPVPLSRDGYGCCV